MMISLIRQGPLFKQPWFYSRAHNLGTLKSCEIHAHQRFLLNSCMARLALYWECWDKGKCIRKTVLKGGVCVCRCVGVCVCLGVVTIQKDGADRQLWRVKENRLVQ